MGFSVFLGLPMNSKGTAPCQKLSSREGSSDASTTFQWRSISVPEPSWKGQARTALVIAETLGNFVSQWSDLKISKTCGSCVLRTRRSTSSMGRMPIPP